MGRRTDSRTSAPAGSRHRSKATLLILDGVTGEPIDSIVLPGIDMLAPPSAAGPMMPLRLSRSAVFAVGSRSIFYCGQDGAGIIEFDGSLNRVSVIELWVQDPVKPGIHPLTWTAYEDGKAVLRAEVPPRFFRFEFGEDWVLGVSFDELNIERVQLWRLAPGTFRDGGLTPHEAEPPTLSRCGAWRSR
ncbi:MAG TPA: hypothetical protein VMM79_07220 [Longimicrobiales bacterium]|nr:hypothetical protein [Longimicrobiales bacterium]